MPEKPFTVNIYEVVVRDADDHQYRMIENSFETAIDAANTASFTDKNKDVDGKMRRLEHCSEQDGYYLMNFATAAFDGPGHFSQNDSSCSFWAQNG